MMRRLLLPYIRLISFRLCRCSSVPLSSSSLTERKTAPAFVVHGAFFASPTCAPATSPQAPIGLRLLNGREMVWMRHRRVASVIGHGSSAVQAKAGSRQNDDERMLYPLSKYFNGEREYIFDMRRNPRKYEWTDKEVEQLWTDIHDGFTGESDVNNHMDLQLNMIMLLAKDQDKKDQKEQGTVFYVEDGQQRLMTVCIFLAVIRDKFKEHSDKVGLNDDSSELLELHKETAQMLFPTKPRKKNVTRALLMEQDNMYFNRILTGDVFGIRDLSKMEKKALGRVDKLVLEHYEWTHDSVAKMMEGHDVVDYATELRDYIRDSCYVFEYLASSTNEAHSLLRGLSKGKNMEAIDFFKLQVYSELIPSDQEVRMRECQEEFDSLMEDGDAKRESVSEAALLLAEAALPKRCKKDDRLNLYHKHLKGEGVDGMEVVERLKHAMEVLERLKNGRHNVLAERGSKEAGERPCLLYLSILTREAACDTFRCVCLKLLIELEGNPELLARRLVGLERVVLCFVRRSPAVLPAKRHERARAMIDSMHEENPAAYTLNAEERRACVEGLEGTFEGIKGGRVARAVLLKLNQYRAWEDCEGQTEAHVSLEHVMPQTLGKGSWKEDWPDVDRHAEWLQKLGNFAIVNEKMNSAMGNSGFTSKKMQLGKSVFPLTRKIGEQESWTEQDVAKNHESMIELACKVFDL